MEEIQNGQDLLEYIKNYGDKVVKLIDIIKQRTYIKDSKIHFKFNVKPNSDEEKKFSTMLFNYSNYMESLESYYAHLDKLLTINEMLIIREPILQEIKPIMRNYIYSLGVPVNRWITSNIVLNNTTRFIIKYNNATQHFVRIKIPFTEEEIMLQNNIKKKDRFHHFFIYKTGTISQTGMHYDTMKILFNELMNIIRDHYQEIIYLDMDFLLDDIVTA
jgi:hypothetical protein